MRTPAAYFLTWTTYGTWLHGDGRGSIDDAHNRYGRPVNAPNTRFSANIADRLSESPLILDTASRGIVERAIRAHCARRRWRVHALNARSNHVHVVLTADDRPPELVLRSLKSWATRSLMTLPEHESRKSFWTRHGSTRYLWDDRAIHDASRDVMEMQEGTRFFRRPNTKTSNA